MKKKGSRGRQRDCKGLDVDVEGETSKVPATTQRNHGDLLEAIGEPPFAGFVGEVRGWSCK